jgi:hypothetical protein
MQQGMPAGQGQHREGFKLSWLVQAGRLAPRIPLPRHPGHGTGHHLMLAECPIQYALCSPYAPRASHRSQISLATGRASWAPSARAPRQLLPLTLSSVLPRINVHPGPCQILMVVACRHAWPAHTAPNACRTSMHARGTECPPRRDADSLCPTKREHDADVT